MVPTSASYNKKVFVVIAFLLLLTCIASSAAAIVKRRNCGTSRSWSSNLSCSITRALTGRNVKVADSEAHDHEEEEDVVVDDVHALSSSIKRQELVSQISVLAREFKPVIRGRGLLRQIDLVRLIKACRALEATVKRTGPQQVVQFLESNLKKVESSPYYNIEPKQTVSSLLEMEKEMGNVVREDGKLADASAAVGLLWIRRSIAFQYRFYESLIEETTNHQPREAVVTAYRKELQPYHGRALQRIYSICLRTLVPTRREDVLARLGGFQDHQQFGQAEEMATKRDLRTLLDVWRPLLVRWEEIYKHLDLEDTSIAGKADA